MTNNERQERLASDLKNAIVHEVGHAIFALRSGCDKTFVEIWLKRICSEADKASVLTAGIESCANYHLMGPMVG